jgi:hypothetical protein
MACRDLDLIPSTFAQYSGAERALSYVFKDRLGSGPTSLRSLLSRAARGDADAHDDWCELDAWRNAHPRARFRQSFLKTNSTPPPTRDQHHTNADDRDLAQLAILSALGITSKPQQARTLGISESTVSRRRRHFAPGYLGAPGRIYFRVSENES